MSKLGTLVDTKSEAFEKNTEADVRRVFAALLETGGAQLIGIDALPKDFMTLAYQ